MQDQESHSCCSNCAADFRAAGSISSMPLMKSIKAPISVSGISGGLLKGLTSPFTMRSRFVGFKSRIRRSFPSNPNMSVKQLSNSAMHIGCIPCSSKNSAERRPLLSRLGGNGPRTSLILAKWSSSAVQDPLSDAFPEKRTMPWTNSTTCLYQARILAFVTIWQFTTDKASKAPNINSSIPGSPDSYFRCPQRGWLY